MTNSGLSIGQRQALASGTDSKFESVMGDAGASISRKAQRIIDVNDLVIDEPIPVSGATANTTPAESANLNSGMGGVDGSIGQGSSSSTDGSYLNNPVKDGTGWLFNQQLPSVLLKHEKPEHRIMLYLKAQGKSNAEVAQYMGYSGGQVSQITRQPWFVQSLRDLLVEAGSDIVRKVLEGAALDSVICLINLRDDEKTGAAVRMQCSNSLLDRLLGKPKQEVAIERKETPTQAVTRIDTELDVLESREADLKKQLSRFAQ